MIFPYILSLRHVIIYDFQSFCIDSINFLFKILSSELMVPSPDVSSVVIVVCVAVLMVVVVSVIYQLYLKHVQEVPDTHTQLKDEKDLDLSALTITVNPLEVSRGLEKQISLKMI